MTKKTPGKSSLLYYPGSYTQSQGGCKDTGDGALGMVGRVPPGFVLGTACATIQGNPSPVGNSDVAQTQSLLRR